MSKPSDTPSGTALADAGTATSLVTDEETGCTFEVPEGRTILDAALAQDVLLRHGCRVGACGACAVEVVEGLTATVAPDPIERNTLARYDLPGRVRLACRTTLRGRVRIRPA